MVSRRPRNGQVQFLLFTPDVAPVITRQLKKCKLQHTASQYYIFNLMSVFID